jgi:hypothetical protein
MIDLKQSVLSRLMLHLVHSPALETSQIIDFLEDSGIDKKGSINRPSKGERFCVSALNLPGLSAPEWLL